MVLVIDVWRADEVEFACVGNEKCADVAEEAFAVTAGFCGADYRVGG